MFKNSFSVFSNQSNVDERQLIQIVAFFWAIIKIFSIKLWLSNRSFPLSPVFQFLENIPNYVHILLLVAFFIGIVSILFKTKLLFFTYFIICIEIISCMLDQNRWQPFQYQFILIFLFYTLYHNSKKQFFSFLIFLILSIYFFSGLHKISGSFLNTIWKPTVISIFDIKNTVNYPLFIHYLGLFVGFFELLLGIGLFFKNTCKIAAYLLILMHLGIIIILSPVGFNYNIIVIPWNILMIILLFLVFIKSKSFTQKIKLLTYKFNIILFALIGMMPFLRFFGYWDNYLSFNLYSGSTKYLEICIDDVKKINHIKNYPIKKGKICKENYAISVLEWSLSEMNTAVYPEKRVYLDVIKKWKKQNPNIKATFYIYEYPFDKQNIEVFH